MAIGVVVLVGVGVILKQVITPAPPPRCVFTCANPPTGPYQPTGEVFTSNQFGFSFEYPTPSTSYPATGARLADYVYNDGRGTFFGQLWIAAGTGTTSPGSLIAGEVSHLVNSNEIQNVQDAGPILGAEVGFQPAVGEFYTGDFAIDSGGIYIVDFGVIALQHNNDWVYLVAISAVSAENHQPDMYSTFDDILSRWRWAS